MKKIIGFIICLFILGVYNAKALVINDNFDSSANWVSNGDAAVKLGVGYLTENEMFQAGSLWYNSIFDLTKYSTFKVTFDFVLDGSADGITFSVIDANNGNDALGYNGGRLGYGGIPNSFAVEFDIFHNMNWDPIYTNDPDHVGIDINGSVVSITTSTNVPNLNDGALHTATIEFDIINNTISVTVDNFISISNYSLPVELNFSNVYFGFTGATGAVSATQYVDNFNLNLSSVPLPSSVILLGCGVLSLIGIKKIKK